MVIIIIIFKKKPRQKWWKGCPIAGRMLVWEFQTPHIAGLGHHLGHRHCPWVTNRSHLGLRNGSCFLLQPHRASMGEPDSQREWIQHFSTLQTPIYPLSSCVSIRQPSNPCLCFWPAGKPDKVLSVTEDQEQRQALVWHQIGKKWIDLEQLFNLSLSFPTV